jgi:hypothetical protein
MRLARRSLQVRNGVWRLGNRSGFAITVLRIPICDLISTVLGRIKERPRSVHKYNSIPHEVPATEAMISRILVPVILPSTLSTVPDIAREAAIGVRE